MRPTPDRHPRGARWLGGLLVGAVVVLSGCAPSAPAAGPGTASSAAATSVAPSAAAGTSIGSASASSVPAASAVPAPASPVPASPTAAPAPAPVEPPTAAPLVLPTAAPVSLAIPAIGVTSNLSTLGRNPDGTVEVPSLDDPSAGAGWFRDSPAPGALGPSIILGHVDSRAFGPGVFYSLRDLKQGDQVEIARADSTVAVFQVDSVEVFPKAQFPTEKVYANIDHAGLRLITCGGDFDENAHSYLDNVVAFASLVSSHPA